MTRRIICFLFFLFGSHLVHAQGGFKGGILAGVDVSDIAGMDTIDHDEDFSKAGFLAGASVNLPLSAQNSLQMEITYIQKGFSQPQLPLDSSGNSANNGYFYKLSLNYVEVPVLFKHKIRFTVKNKVIEKFDVEGGLSFARLVKSKEQDNISSNLKRTNLVKDNYSVHFGVSYLISQKLSFNVRFSNSLNPVMQRNSFPPIVANHIFLLLTRGTNAVWAFTLRYSFV